MIERRIIYVLKLFVFFCVWYFFSYYYFTDCEDMWKSQSFFEGNTFQVNCVVGRDIFFPLVLFIILKFFSLCFLFFHKVLAVRPFSHFFFLYRRWRVLTRKFEGVSGVNRLATKQGRKILLTTDKTGKKLPTTDRKNYRHEPTLSIFVFIEKSFVYFF